MGIKFSNDHTTASVHYNNDSNSVENMTFFNHKLEISYDFSNIKNVDKQLNLIWWGMNGSPDSEKMYIQMNGQNIINFPDEIQVNTNNVTFHKYWIENEFCFIPVKEGIQSYDKWKINGWSDTSLYCFWRETPISDNLLLNYESDQELTDESMIFWKHYIYFDYEVWDAPYKYDMISATGSGHKNGVGQYYDKANPKFVAVEKDYVGNNTLIYNIENKNKYKYMDVFIVFWDTYEEPGLYFEINGNRKYVKDVANTIFDENLSYFEQLKVEAKDINTLKFRDDKSTCTTCNGIRNIKIVFHN